MLLAGVDAGVDEGDTRISLRDWVISSWATRGILALCGEREHEVPVYDLAVRPKLEAGMIHMYECIPLPPLSRLRTSPTVINTNPRKRWSLRLNLR